MITIPGGMYLSPADLGLLDVVPAAAGGFSDGKWLDWQNKFPIRALAFISEHITNNGATPINVAITGRNFDGEAFVTAVKETLWQNYTNNPRTQYCFFNFEGVANANGLATSGTPLGNTIACLFAAGQARFSLQNNHATLTDTLRLHAIVWFRQQIMEA